MAERPGDRHALLLATREIAWTVVAPIAQPDLVQELTGAGLRLSPATGRRPAVGPSRSPAPSGSG